MIVTVCLADILLVWQVCEANKTILLKPFGREGEGYIYRFYIATFVDGATGKMNPQYTNDGLHLLGKGYLLWRDIVKPYVNKK